MAEYAPRQWHVDDERFTEDGHSGRFILPSQPGRRPDCSTAFILNSNGTQRAPILEFWNRAGDTSCNDRDAYKAMGKAELTPARAMKVWEGDARLNRWGVPIVKEFKLQVLDRERDGTILPPTSAWFHVLSQLNVYKQGENAGGVKVNIGPIVNIGAKIDFILDPETSKPKRDASRREMRGEFFTFDVNYWDASQGKSVAVRNPAVPLLRRAITVRETIIDSRGGPGGLFRVEMDGRVVCDYRGPVGYPDYPGSYSAIGTYRHCNATEAFGVRFEGYRETVAT